MLTSPPTHDFIDDSRRPLSLRKNLIWTFFANAFYAACQCGLISLLAKSEHALDRNVLVGQYILGLAIAGPIFGAANLKLRHLQATDSRNEYLFGDYLSLRLLSILVASIVLTIVAFCVGNSQETILIILFVGLAKALESISDIFYGLFQHNERFDRIGKSKLLHGEFGLVVFAIAIYSTHSLVWGTACFALSRLVLIIAFDIPGAIWMLSQRGDGSQAVGWQRLKNRLSILRPIWRPRKIGGLLSLGIPLGISVFLIALNTKIPQYFVTHFRGLQDLGVLGAIAAFIIAGGTVSRALNQTCAPKLAKLHAAGQITAFRRLFGKLLGVYVALGVVGVAAAMIAGRWILTILFQPRFADHSDVLVCVMIAASLLYLSGAISTAIISMRVIRFQLPMVCMTTLTCLVLCYVLVPTHGIRGAAVALAISRVPYVIAGLALVWWKTAESNLHRATIAAATATAAATTAASAAAEAATAATEATTAAATAATAATSAAAAAAATAATAATAAATAATVATTAAATSATAATAAAEAATAAEEELFDLRAQLGREQGYLPPNRLSA